jgi:acylphosphatase
MAEHERSVRVRVTGRVQGVGFRAWAAREAERRGVSGGVRNEPDGSVAALLAGPAAAVEEVIGALARGPRGAAVAEVASEPAEPPAAGFRITG